MALIPFGKIDQNNTVVYVTVVVDDVIRDADGNVSEQLGNEFLKSILGDDCFYLMMTESGSPHRNVGGINYLWRPEINAFQAPQPYLSWSFNENTLNWEAPIPYPNDGQGYYWNEANQTWDLLP